MAEGQGCSKGIGKPIGLVDKRELRVEWIGEMGRGFRGRSLARNAFPRLENMGHESES